MSRNVTVRQLRALVAVVQERSFTRAAARLHLTQSALTMAIRALEAEVGLQLLDRSTRLVSPTGQGEHLGAVAERLLEELDRAVEDLRAHAERRRGLVAVAAAASFIGHVFAPVLGTLAQRYPGISVRLVEEHTGGAARRLLAGEVDFAVTTLPSPDPALTAVPLLRDRFGLVCPAGHPLAQAGGTLGWGVLRAHPVVGLGPQSGIRALLEQHPASAPALRPRYEVSSVAGLQSLVEQGLGVAAMPALAALPMRRNGLVFRLLTPAMHRVVFLAMRPGRSSTPAASAVVAALLEQLAALRSEDVEILAAPATLARLGFDLATPA